tara:strand:- start:665 stop:1174 length:510 start_codon:yes stop_codon:yes gene_type:complete
MIKLDKLRIEIDNIDKNISNLIIKRQSLADKIVAVKGNNFPFDPEREKKLIKKILGFGLNPLVTERIWRQIISSNLARQKQLKIGILDDDKYTLAAYEAYFGPYFRSYFFNEKKKLMEQLNQKKIDIVFIDKEQYFTGNDFRNIFCVANFPLKGNFYKKKFSILINKNN